MTFIEKDITNHSTIAIIDVKQKLIEHFNSSGINKIYNKIYDKFFKEILPEYKYVKLWEMCPILPQIKVDAFEGMCLTYTMMYLLLRLFNPDSDSQDILNYMITGDKNELISRLLKFHRYIELTVKKTELDDIIKEAKKEGKLIFKKEDLEENKSLKKNIEMENVKKNIINIVNIIANIKFGADFKLLSQDEIIYIVNTYPQLADELLKILYRRGYDISFYFIS